MLLFFRLQLRRAGRSPVDFACFSDRGMKNATTGLQRNRGTKYKTGQKLPFLKGKYLDSSHSQPTADYSRLWPVLYCSACWLCLLRPS